MDDDEQSLIATTIARCALANIARISRHSEWPQWFADQIEEVARQGVAHGIQLAHQRRTIPAPPSPTVIVDWEVDEEAVTPIRNFPKE